MTGVFPKPLASCESQRGADGYATETKQSRQRRDAMLRRKYSAPCNNPSANAAYDPCDICQDIEVTVMLSFHNGNVET